jgi:hypothetical protein
MQCYAEDKPLTSTHMSENNRRRRYTQNREGQPEPQKAKNIEQKALDPQLEESGRIPQETLKIGTVERRGEIPVPGPDATSEEVERYLQQLEEDFEEWCQTSGLDERATRTMKEAQKKGTVSRS